MILYKMPKKAIDYSKTLIYKIVCNDLNITECYVGHTTNFIKRKNLHKSDCTNNNSKSYNLKIYQFIRANSGWDNFSMLEIEKYPCNDINEATARERHWYEQLNAILNTQIPSRTKREYIKEYYETNKEQILEKAKEYRETNKEQILEYRETNKQHFVEYQKEYYETNKEQFLEKAKEYYETNKKQILQQKKEYRETNREQINEKQKQKFDCECGGKYILCHKLRHLNTQKHNNYLNSKVDEY